MISFKHYITEKKQSFLRGVKYRGGNPRQDHKYEFEHEGKNKEGHPVRHPVEVDFDTMPSGKQQVNFSVGGRMTRMGNKGMARPLYKKIGSVIRAHDKLGRGVKGGYEFQTHHDTGLSGKGGRSGTRSKVTGRLLKKLATRINKKYSHIPAGDSGTGARVTTHTVEHTE